MNKKKDYASDLRLPNTKIVILGFKTIQLLCRHLRHKDLKTTEINKLNMMKFSFLIILLARH